MVRWTGALHEDVFVWDRAQFQPPRGVFELLVALPTQRWELRARHGLVYRFERPPGYTDPERIPLVEVRDRHDSIADPGDRALERWRGLDHLPGE